MAVRTYFSVNDTRAGEPKLPASAEQPSRGERQVCDRQGHSGLDESQIQERDDTSSSALTLQGSPPWSCLRENSIRRELTDWESGDGEGQRERSK